MLKLGLKLDGPTGKAAHVTLNGMDIGPSLTGLDLHIRVGEVNTATLHILLDSIELEGDTLAVLNAYLEQQEHNTDPMKTYVAAA